MTTWNSSFKIDPAGNQVVASLTLDGLPMSGNNPLPIYEPGQAIATNALQPGGVGLTGWLSQIDEAIRTGGSASASGSAQLTDPSVTYEVILANDENTLIATIQGAYSGAVFMEGLPDAAPGADWTPIQHVPLWDRSNTSPGLTQASYLSLVDSEGGTLVANISGYRRYRLRTGPDFSGSVQAEIVASKAANHVSIGPDGLGSSSSRPLYVAGTVGLDSTNNAVTIKDWEPQTITLAYNTSLTSQVYRLANGEQTLMFWATGISSTDTLVIDASYDGTLWKSSVAMTLELGTAGNRQITLSATGATFNYRANVAGYPYIRFRLVNGSGTASATVGFAFSKSLRNVGIDNLPPLTAGTNLIGKVGIDQTAGQNVVALTPASTGGFWPNPTGTTYPVLGPGVAGALTVDSNSNLRVRGSVTTDEGSVREDFPGTSLYTNLTGTVTLTNGSTTVTGSGTKFTTELTIGDYVRLSTHADSALAQVESVLSDTQAKLVMSYTGATGSGTGTTSPLQPSTTGGGAFSVANSKLTIGAGTTASAITNAWRKVDYGPLVWAGVVDVSQRLAANTGYLGLQDDPANPLNFARFKLTGTVNTQVIFETAGTSALPVAASEIETTTVTLPSGGTTATAHKYRIELLVDRVLAFIDDVLVAQHQVHLPGPYAPMGSLTGWVNSTAPASSSLMNVDVMTISNVDRFQTMPVSFVADPQPITGTATAAANTAVTVTIPAPNAGQSIYLTDIDATYNTTTGIGLLTVKDNQGTPVTYYQTYVNAGRGLIQLKTPIKVAAGFQAVVTLAALNSNIGTVNVQGYVK